MGQKIRIPLLAMLCGMVLLVFGKVFVVTITDRRPAKKAIVSALPLLHTNSTNRSIPFAE